ncbi:hypothetical protein HN859_05530, partial [Candidatus Parcubacteria bacterium]|nr:hypothetical protein [Candidatus Parcubacteria bacterium]
IKDYPKEITNQDPFVVRGETYPDSQVVVWLQREATDPVSYIVKSNTEGKFTFIADEKLRDGVYNMWAEVVDKRGARSEPTQKYTIVVQKPRLLQIGNTTISILSVVIPLIALIFFLAFIAWFMWFRLRSLRSRIKVEVNEAHRALHKEITFLKKEVKSHAKLMEKYLAKKRLTKAEKLEMAQFQKDLQGSIKRVDKEIDDIKKEVK